jgi:hypothetical protein
MSLAPATVAEWCRNLQSGPDGRGNEAARPMISICCESSFSMRIKAANRPLSAKI